MDIELKDAVENGLKTIKAHFETEIAKTNATVLDMAQKMTGGYTSAGSASSMSGAPNVLTKALEGEAFTALRQGRSREAVVPLELAIKAITNDGQTGSITTQPLVAPGVVGAPAFPLDVLDVLPVMPVSASAFEFNQLTGAFAYASDYQAAQGDTKAEQGFPTTLVSAPIVTIAAIANLSEQVLQDAPALRQQAGTILTYGARKKLAWEVVRGTGAGKIQGLLTVGTAFVPTGTPSNVDAISQAIAALRNAGFEPSAVLVNPADWGAIITSKSSGSGEYMSGSYDMPATPNVWGVRAIVTAAVPAGKAVVFDPMMTTLLDRMQPQLMVGYSGDGFSKNLLTLRAELRAGFAVFAPTSVAVITLT